MTNTALLGTWRLVSYESRSEDGRTHYPYGQAATADEYAAAMRTYVSYSGRYQVLADRVVHHLELCLLPNWTGTDQERFYQLGGNRLRLHAPPFVIGGIRQTAHLVWERV